MMKFARSREFFAIIDEIDFESTKTYALTIVPTFSPYSAD
jgi:hypothetical protein